MDEFTSFLNLIKRSEAEEQGKFATDFAENMAKIDNAFSSTKQKLDDIDAALNGKASTSHASTHITGGTDVIPDAVAGESSGLMSGADKQKLDDATATDTAFTLVIRDANKRAKFADPAENQDAATKKYVDDNLSGKVDKVAEAVEDNIAVLDENGNIKDSGEKTSDFVRTLFEEVIIGEDWEGDEPPYTQEITLEGITADNRPIVSPLYDDDLEVAIAQQEAWNLIDKIVTDEDKITCYCFTDKPEVEIPIQLWVV